MRILPRDRRTESWEQTRARLVAETSVYLTECLRHPELVVRIPVVQAGTARFPRSFAQVFWERLLTE
jgi:hypothetical protein